MLSRSPWRVVLSIGALVIVGVTMLVGCAGPSLPPAADLLGRAVPVTGAVTSAHFTVRVDPGPSPVTVRGADGDLTRAGAARGTAQLDQQGQLVEVAFVIVGDALYLKGPTGGFQRLPAGFASTVYDPSAILDPQRGLARLVATATQARTEDSETVGGREAYRVGAVVDPGVAATLVPGLTGPVTGQLWVDAATSQLLQARIQPSGGSGAGAVTLTLSNLDAPVAIVTPA